MTNKHQSNLAVFAVERSLANKIDVKCVVDMFDAAHDDGRRLLH